MSGRMGTAEASGKSAVLRAIEMARVARAEVER